MPFSDKDHPLNQVDNLKRALHAAGVALWSWSVETDAFAMDEQGFRLWGLPQADQVTFEDLSSRIHPADRDRVRAAFTATRALVGAYEIDFRIILGEEIRWISARGLGNDEGLHNGQMSGVFLDVTGRKQAEEGHELLAGEMSHRVKNLLAIATGLTNITSRSATSVTEMARELTQRLTALGRAHDVVRPLAGNQGRAALIGDLIAVLLAPYDDQGAFSGRIRVAVPRMGVGEQSAMTLALVIHELATNSLKYGALSVRSGMLDVSGTSSDNEVCIVWTERGGPFVASSGREGYGSQLLNRSVTGQLGGSIVTDWSNEGIIVTVRMNAEKLSQ
ncbi:MULTISPECIES: sensor histidine kinase [unclassified Mesorhizobium]|nr:MULTISPECIES: sensor histidine kinase [unclassified Mesorhizobium]TGT50530.1 histidine kinase [Mesorhizobium sp. M8A.F.Ca.ET.167.01.1.1]TGU40365.1 histidine kinase [bacterium M00.F.Ca.ET.156.01.1.1]TGV15509.1 histidine kinase [Mesorhizobium sp. M8A.F.Ca.ET.173.01.1.1]TIT30967.1 MAG: histidine kinase [Mesorhizobium sp.]TGQ77130.1 histidine kinase [Mesorhizobium sp. M8A.F.Ca.ET.207.01.1.1]